MDLSIVIPLGPKDDVPLPLLQALKASLKVSTYEILLACGPQTRGSVGEVLSPWGRANQQNAGAKAAKGKWIWFLHADSQLEPDTVPALLSSIKKDPNALWFFRLKFAGNGFSKMRLNEVGVRFRSELLQIPFGDQGFLIPKTLFLETPFSPDLPYGEDHALVWQLRRKGVPIRCTGAALTTSARKYEEQGWLNVTRKHLTLTFLQAWNEWRKGLT